MGNKSINKIWVSFWMQLLMNDDNSKNVSSDDDRYYYEHYAGKDSNNDSNNLDINISSMGIILEGNNK